MANMADVAKLAGVGISTVSKVINNYDNISEETRKKVLAAVEELDYVPNVIASALSSKNGKRIGLVVFINNERQAIDQINMQYIFGAFKQGKLHGLDIVTIFSSLLENKNAKELEAHFKSLRVQSLVVYGIHKEEGEFETFIKNTSLPIVVVDAPFINETTTSVMIDHQQAQYDITKKMVEDHAYVDNILYLAGRRDGFVTDLRMQGIVNATMELGISLNTQYSDFSEKKAYKLTKDFASENNVIICASDLMAIGAVSALNDMDIFRPVCGFDGISLLGYIDYEIMTVKQDFYAISKRAIDEAVRLTKGGRGQAVVLDYKIGYINYKDVIM